MAPRTERLAIGRHRLNAEIAETPWALALGLMFRRRLAPGRGMLLRFGRDADHALHTWFVRFPLDLIFLDRRRRVAAIRTVPPWSGPIRCGRRIREVLEVPAGWCRRRGIRVGARLRPA
jgi:uncharacterized membrane protein (UPF0127 family)